MADEAQQFFDTSKEKSGLHPEDEANLSHTDESDSDTEPTQPFNLSEKEAPPNMPIFKSTTHLAHNSYQTGVKGVLADAHSFESARRKELRTSPRQQTHHERGRSLAELTDDDELMNAWRKNRLQELRSGQINTRRHSPSKRNYGRVEPVDAAGYLDAIERVSRETIVLVLIYDSQSHESRFVEDCLVTLAKRYPTTRFVKLPHIDAEMDGAVVPAVLAYKGGDLIRTVMRVVDEIPSGRNLSTESLELVLQRAKILIKD